MTRKSSRPREPLHTDIVQLAEYLKSRSRKLTLREVSDIARGKTPDLAFLLEPQALIPEHLLSSLAKDAARSRNSSKAKSAAIQEGKARKNATDAEIKRRWEKLAASGVRERHRSKQIAIDSQRSIRTVQDSVRRQRLRQNTH